MQQYIWTCARLPYGLVGLIALLTISCLPGNGHDPSRCATAPEGCLPIAVAAGGNEATGYGTEAGHSLVLLADGTVYAWGSDAFGQVGKNSGECSLPVQVMTDVQAIAAGGHFSLALAKDGSVYFWGSMCLSTVDCSNPILSSDHPVKLEGLADVTMITAGFNHALALDSTGRVYAWGENASGQLGNGACCGALKVPTRISGLDLITAISAGDGESMALDEAGEVWVWGKTADGADTAASDDCLATYSGYCWQAPHQVLELSRVKRIAAAGEHFLARDDGNVVYMWGSNYRQQIDNSVDETIETPKESIQLAEYCGELDDLVQDLYAGIFHNLALTGDHELVTWGNNDFSQLGHDGADSVCGKVQLAGEEPAVWIAAAGGVSHSLGISGGTVYAWGSNLWGQLGSCTDLNPSPSPMEVKLPTAE